VGAAADVPDRGVSRWIRSREVLRSSRLVAMLFNCVWLPMFLLIRVGKDDSTPFLLLALLPPLLLALVLPSIQIGRSVRVDRFGHGVAVGIIGWALVLPGAMLAIPVSAFLAFLGAPLPEDAVGGQGAGLLAFMASIAGIALSPAMGEIAFRVGKMADKRLVTDQIEETP
jgi:hypothetical protein